jgi:hypothetical protein
MTLNVIVQRSKAATAIRVRDGYALVLVLSMIVIAALMTAGLARSSLSLALDGIQAEDDLQRRWASAGIRQTVLPRGQAILDSLAADDTVVPAPSVLDLDLNLAGHTFHLVLADEDAKLNLNMVYYARGIEEVSRHLRQANRTRLTVRLRPYRGAADDEQLPVFDSWGQAFDCRQANDTPSLAADLQSLTRHFTCWGSRRLNFRRATDESLRRACDVAGAAPSADKLIELRRNADPRRLDEVLNRLQLNDRERSSLAALLATDSTCLSLWTSSTQTAASWEFHVAEEAGDGRVVVSSFVW